MRTILLAIANEIYRCGLAAICRETIPGLIIREAENLSVVKELLEHQKADLMVIDLHVLSGEDAALSDFFEALPDLRLLLIYDLPHWENALYALIRHPQITGCICNQLSRRRLDMGLRELVAGKAFICSQTATYLQGMASVKKDRPFGRPLPQVLFIPREKQIIALLCQEFTAKEIASQLSLSTRTVENRKVRIQEKMQVRNCAGIVAYAFRHHLYPQQSDLPPGAIPESLLQLYEVY